MQNLGLQKLHEIALDTGKPGIDLPTVWRPGEAFHRRSKVGIAQEKINDR